MLTTDKRQRIRSPCPGLAALLMVCCLVVMNSVAAARLASTVRGACGRRARFWADCRVRSHSQRLVAPLQRPGPHPGADPLRHHLLCGSVCDRRACAGRHLPILAIILMFGIFGSPPAQMLGVLVYSLVAFGVASGVVAARDEPDYPTVVAAAYVGMVVVVLLSSTFLTTRVQSTREHLRRQRPNWRRRWSKSASWPRTMT